MGGQGRRARASYQSLTGANSSSLPHTDCNNEGGAVRDSCPSEEPNGSKVGCCDVVCRRCMHISKGCGPVWRKFVPPRNDAQNNKDPPTNVRTQLVEITGRLADEQRQTPQFLPAARTLNRCQQRLATPRLPLAPKAQWISHRRFFSGVEHDPDTHLECGIQSVGGLPSILTHPPNVSTHRTRVRGQAPSALPHCSSRWPLDAELLGPFRHQCPHNGQTRSAGEELSKPLPNPTPGQLAGTSRLDYHRFPC